ncbi:MAG: FecR domain-containing protein [Cyclobacteriaceae bacterium]
MDIEQRDFGDNLIANYLSGTATPEEEKELITWIGLSERNKQYYDQLRNIWITSDMSFDPESINTDLALEKVLKRISKETKLLTFWLYWKNVAAIILIPVLLGYVPFLMFRSGALFTSPKPIYSEAHAAFGSRTHLRLPDGSLVWLNSGSSVKFPDRFVEDERVVYLTGEAYFEIVSNPSMPFHVQTSSLDVKVTGTAFNVSDYRTDTCTTVTLVSGEVFVNEITNGSRRKLLAQLHPNQHLIFGKRDKTVQLSNDNAYEYVAWKDGKLVFRNKPLSFVVKKIGQVFNVDIVLQGSQQFQDYRYRATFQDESLTEILKLLKISSPLDFTEVKRSPLADGSFPKKKIIIFPSNEGTQKASK